MKDEIKTLKDLKKWNEDVIKILSPEVLEENYSILKCKEYINALAFAIDILETF